MKKFGILKIVLCAIALSLSGCKILEDAPEVWKCQYNGSPRAFFCVNTKTNERRKVPAESGSMKAAQCLSADDYAAMERYVEYLINEAQCN